MGYSLPFANKKLTEKNTTKLSTTFFSLAKASLQIPFAGLPLALACAALSLLFKGLEHIFKIDEKLALKKTTEEGYRMADAEIRQGY